ncbi:taste receptor cell protein 1-like [Thomomys bottae]
MPTAWIPSSALAAVVPGSQDSGSASSGVGHVTRSLTFRVTHGFPALESPASVSHQQLRGYLCHQCLLNQALRQALGETNREEKPSRTPALGSLLRDRTSNQTKTDSDRLQSIFHLDFPTFKGIGVLVFGPGPADVTATLVFGGQLGPSAHQVLWTLYREVKASRWMLGSLSLAEDSLASDGAMEDTSQGASGAPDSIRDSAGFNLTDLSLETISLHFTILTPFLPQLLLPRSEPFVLLEQQILQQLTPLVSGFYKKQLQERPLVLFGNVDQWVSVDLEYKFHSPVPAHLRGLANHLARSSTDLALLKSSLEANGEKAKLELYELWLLIQGGPFTKALQNKTSLEFQKLQLQLTEWLTPGLRPLRNFAQVVVQEFWPEPLTANVGVIFFTPAPARALVWESVHRVLQCPAEVEGLWVEVTGPDHGAASSTASSLPGPGVPSSTFRVLHAVVILILAKELK